jgi:hypothetical protein
MRSSRFIHQALAPLSSFLVVSALATAGVALARESMSFDSRGDFEYAYVEPGPDGDEVVSGNYSSQVDDIARDTHGPVLWFERDGEEYVVKGAPYTSRAHTALQPVMDLGRQQGELGAKQGKLGAKQGKYGARMGALGARMGEIATREAERQMDGQSTDDLSSEREQIRHKMEEVRKAQEPLAEKQRDLGAQQRELGSRQRDASKKADAELRSILDDAIRAGAASKLASSSDDGYWTI